jgi:hypothetical protein
MTVTDLLDHIDSRELSEWDAFERAFGPLGDAYQKEALAAIHDKLEQLMYVIGMEYGEENPVPKPEQYPRPSDVFKTKEEDLGMTVEEFNQEFDD